MRAVKWRIHGSRSGAALLTLTIHAAVSVDIGLYDATGPAEEHSHALEDGVRL